MITGREKGMVFSYFPGCTLKTKAKDLDLYTRKSAEALGIELEELPEWQCCGAVYPQAKDEIATKTKPIKRRRRIGNGEKRYSRWEFPSCTRML